VRGNTAVKGGGIGAQGKRAALCDCVYTCHDHTHAHALTHSIPGNISIQNCIVSDNVCSAIKITDPLYIPPRYTPLPPLIVFISSPFTPSIGGAALYVALFGLTAAVTVTNVSFVNNTAIPSFSLGSTIFITGNITTNFSGTNVLLQLDPGNLTNGVYISGDEPPNPKHQAPNPNSQTSNPKLQTPFLHS
jgi:hypothetical protein